MVSQTEILKLSKQHNVPASTIDKDWVLGHLLSTLYSFGDFSENFVFKGGTCLRKCYFKDYRFSEDLDFTLLNESFKMNKNTFQKYLISAEQKSGIRFGRDFLIKDQTHNNVPQGYELSIPFWGANHSPNKKPLPESRWQTKIKIDISFSEKLVKKGVNRPIFHPYSDSQIISKQAIAYDLNEIIAEKLRSLIQRNRPRDIYDLYYLSTTISEKQYKDIYNLLVEKSIAKKIDCCRLENFISPTKAIKNKRSWKNSLVHHMGEDKLIDFNQAYENVERFIIQILKMNL